MENTFLVKFETVDGEKHSYKIHSASKEAVYERIVSSPDGWVEVSHDLELHYIQANKITKFTVISEKEYMQRQEEDQKKMIEALDSWNM